MAVHLYHHTKYIVMKKIIFSTLFLLSIAGFASAQSDSRNSSRSVSNTSTSKHISKASSKTQKTKNNKSTDTQKNSTSKSIVTGNRTEYMQNGQLATRTGHQATPVNSDEYQSVKKTIKKKRSKQ
jgi:hypothetical protein